MRNIKIAIIIILLSIIVFIVCSLYETGNNIKFDKDKWTEVADPLFPSVYRPKMLSDLTTNYKLIGMKYSNLIELLGVPDFKDSISLSYKIVVDYKDDIDPIYTKSLDFTFSKDSTIISFKINEINVK